MWLAILARGRLWRAGRCRCTQLPESDRKCRYSPSQRSHLWGLLHPDWDVLSTARTVHTEPERDGLRLEDKEVNVFPRKSRSTVLEYSNQPDVQCLFVVSVLSNLGLQYFTQRMEIKIICIQKTIKEYSFCFNKEKCCKHVHVSINNTAFMNLQEVHLVFNVGNWSPGDYNGGVSHISAEMRSVGHWWVCRHIQYIKISFYIKTCKNAKDWNSHPASSQTSKCPQIVLLVVSSIHTVTLLLHIGTCIRHSLVVNTAVSPSLSVFPCSECSVAEYSVSGFRLRRVYSVRREGRRSCLGLEPSTVRKSR